jgi:L-cystine uptake protein TcyP (sodium:dicarboxylate symporter family)
MASSFCALLVRIRPIIDLTRKAMRARNGSHQAMAIVSKRLDPPAKGGLRDRHEDRFTAR